MSDDFPKDTSTLEDLKLSPVLPDVKGEPSVVIEKALVREFPENFEFKRDNFLKNALCHVDSQHPHIGELNRIDESTDINKRKIPYSPHILRAAVDDLFMKTGAVDFTRGRDTFREYYSLFFDSSTTGSIDPAGKSELLKFALLSSLSPEFISTLQFRIGMGVHDHDHTSLRLPSYIQPVVSFVAKLCALYRQKDMETTLERLPQVVVYSAANMLKDVNRLDHARATDNAEYFFQVLRRYVETTLPEVAHRAFVFRRDVRANDPEINKHLTKIASHILNVIPDPTLIAKIQNTAHRHHSGPLESMKYAVSHAVYSLDPMEMDYTSFLEDEEGPLHPSVIMVGGKSEVDYWRVRQLVRTSSSQHARVQMIQKFGEVPPYGGSLEGLDLTTAHLRDPQEFKAKFQSLRTQFRKEVLVTLPFNSQNVDVHVDDMVSYFRSLFDIV